MGLGLGLGLGLRLGLGLGFRLGLGLGLGLGIGLEARTASRRAHSSRGGCLAYLPCTLPMVTASTLHGAG